MITHLTRGPDGVRVWAKIRTVVVWAWAPLVGTAIRDLHTVFNLPCVYDSTKNCAGKEQKSYRILTMYMFAAQGKAMPHKER